MAQIKRSLFVEARTWFDKTGGNSYFSARIHIDGELVGYLPFQYGYETQYQYEAKHWLIENDYPQVLGIELYRLREQNIDVYTVIYPATKAEVRRFGKDWRDA